MNNSDKRPHQRASVIKMAADIANNIAPANTDDKAQAIALHIQRYWPKNLQEIFLEEALNEHGTLITTKALYQSAQLLAQRYEEPSD